MADFTFALKKEEEKDKEVKKEGEEDDGDDGDDGPAPEEESVRDAPATRRLPRKTRLVCATLCL
jgi:hypothetical protein